MITNRIDETSPEAPPATEFAPAHIQYLSRPRTRCLARGEKAIAATAHPMATAAALQILRDGGNAVDAAVAAAWALSVCEPSGSGIGGQSTMLISFPNGRRVVIDGHSHAPASVSIKTVKKSAQKTGYRAAIIPSTVATLGKAGAEYGRLPLGAQIAPAIELAQSGFAVSKLFRRQIQWCRPQLEKNEPASEILLGGGRVPRRGSSFIQPVLAKTLRRIADAGSDDFYQGEIARTIVKEMEEVGGLIGLSDLSTLNVPVEREPISMLLDGKEIVSVPSPGGGLQLLQAIRVFDKLRNDEMNLYAWYIAIARVIQVVYRDRLSWPFKPEEMTDSMYRWLLGDDRASELASMVRAEDPLGVAEDNEEEGDTTHLCVADPDGLVVTLTQSIQSLYGAKVASRKLGFFYNNYLLTIPRDGDRGRLVGNIAPRSNAAPCMVFDPQAKQPMVPVFAAGAAGSRRITSSLMQTIVNRFWLDMPLGEAVDAPRIHGTLGGSAYVEKRVATKELLQKLSTWFAQIEVKAARSYSMGGVQAIGRDRDSIWSASADPRREGTSGGF